MKHAFWFLQLVVIWHFFSSLGEFLWYDFICLWYSIHIPNVYTNTIFDKFIILNKTLLLSKKKKNYNVEFHLLCSLYLILCIYIWFGSTLWLFIWGYLLLHFVSMVFWNRISFPVSTRRRFDVHTTSITLKQRRMDVKTRSCAYWVCLKW